MGHGFMSGARGVGRLVTAQGEVNVLFTNRALAEAEQITGKSVMQLAATAHGSAVGVGITAQLLAVGMEFARREAGVGGARVTIADAYRVMDELGFSTVATVVLQALADVVSYGVEVAEPDPTRR